MPSLTKIQTGFLDPQGAFELDPGTSSSPGLFFSGNTSTGMFSPSSGVLGFSTGSTQQALTILADGNVGVGYTNPSYKLVVSNTSTTAYSPTVASAPTLMVYNGANQTSSYSAIRFRAANSNGATSIWNFGVAANNTNYQGDLFFQSRTADQIYNEHLRLTSTGNVGIGTTNPNAKLQVEGAIRLSDAIQIRSGSATYWHLSKRPGGQSDRFGIYYWNGAAYGSELLTLGITGNLGVNQTDPTYRLDIGGSANITTQVSVWNKVIGDPQTLIEPGKIYTTAAGLGPGNLQINPTGGNVGIGTTNPNAKLHIFNSALDSTLLYLQGNNNYNYEFRTKTGPTAGGQRLDSFIGSSGAEWSFTDGDNVERLRIKSSGGEGLYVRKGIEVSNHTSVSLLLSRNNAEVTKQHFYVHINNSPWYLYGENLTWTGERSGTTRRANKPYYEGFAPVVGRREFGFVNKTTADTSFVSTDLVSSLTLLNDGNVGIGTTNPSDKLHIEGNTRINSPRFPSSYTERGQLTLTNTTPVATDNNSGAGVASMQPILSLNRYGATNVKFDPFADFSIGSYEMSLNPRTRLDLRLMHVTDSMNIVTTFLSNGNVGIGTTNPVNLLHLNQSTGSGTTYILFSHNGSSTGSIYQDGAGTGYSTSSDYRLKENIIPLKEGLNRVKQLKPCTFNWTNTDVLVEGFIAHEVQSVVPSAVIGEKDALNTDGTVNPQQLDNSKLIPLLVKCIQELTDKIELLESKLSED